jgi:hypothetical protein
MMRLLFKFNVIILLYFGYGLYLANVDLKVVSDLPIQEKRFFYDYRGAINVRSNLSDGGREPLKVIEAAQLANLDFLFMTDLYRSGQSVRYQGYFEQLLVMSGQEYQNLDRRILAIGGPKLNSENISWGLTDWLSQSHFDEQSPLLILSTPFNNQEEAQWGPEWPVGIHGIEVQNPKVISNRVYRSSPLSVIWSLLVYPFNTQYAFLRLYEEPTLELELWDRFQSQKPLVGISGLDANARALTMPGNYIEFPSYRDSFEMMSTHVLLESELSGAFDRDQKLLLNAIKRGQVYFSLDLLGNPKGFSVYLTTEKKIQSMGQRLMYQSDMKIHFNLPAKPRDFFEVVLLQNGQRVATSNEGSGHFEISRAGIYRIIVRVSPFFPLPDAKKWVTWIYTNPFYLLEKP